MIKEKIKQFKVVDTAEKISSCGDLLPTTLSAIFEEEQINMINNSQEEQNVMKAFENRRLDNHYNYII